MLKVAVLVSGGGTNLQAILDAIDEEKIRNARIVSVISNNPNAYALERAKKHGVPAVCITRKACGSTEAFNAALLKALKDCGAELIVLAGCLVVIPKEIIHAYEGRIINIHPSLIPSFCGTGFYGPEAGRQGDGSHRTYRRRGNRHRPNPFTEGRGGKRGRYTGDSAAACHGGGGVDSAAEGYRHARQ